MILTDYYKFSHLPMSKSETRRDCIASTQTYNEFENIRTKDGKLFVYFGDVPMKFKCYTNGMVNKAITKGKNISSVFIPNPSLTLAYGDIRGTKDAILLMFDKDYKTIEIFVASGEKNNRLNLWRMFADGELNDEIAKLRDKAKTEMTNYIINTNPCMTQ